MGTRNLTAVVKDATYKIAQYGQWDGYPSGQGVTALNFVKSKKNREALLKALPRVKWLDEEKHSAKCRELGFNEDGWLTSEQAKIHNKHFPFLTRDHGAKILSLIAESTGEVEIQNQIEFAADSLFCEWAYIIDFDSETFEVYKGFNKAPLPEGERFASLPVADKERREKNGGDVYYPIRLLKRYTFKELARLTQKKFVAELNKLGGDEE